MRHRLRNRIIIRCLSSGVTGCALMPDDADVMPDVRTPDVAYASYATEATDRHRCSRCHLT